MSGDNLSMLNANYNLHQAFGEYHTDGEHKWSKDTGK